MGAAKKRGGAIGAAPLGRSGAKKRGATGMPPGVVDGWRHRIEIALRMGSGVVLGEAETRDLAAHLGITARDPKG